MLESLRPIQIPTPPNFPGAVRERPRIRRPNRVRFVVCERILRDSDGKASPPGGASHRRCGCAVAKRLHGRDIVAALLGLFWRLLREGRLKVARGRSWQPEIGMEHASRGRRSGNKGVGARSRGRFRIFSARHCSRTKVSHAENSGMTMLFFSLAVAPMSEGDSFTGSGETARGG